MTTKTCCKICKYYDVFKGIDVCEKQKAKIKFHIEQDILCDYFEDVD